MRLEAFRTFSVLIVLAIVLSLASPVLAQGTPTYTVLPGDTLTKIARTYGTTVGTLIRLNQGRYPCLAVNAACLRAGWVIAVTAQSAATRPAPAPTAAARITPTVVEANSTTTVEQQIIDLTNQNRSANGLPPLTRDERLMEIARWKSQDLVTRDYFAHDDPVTGRFLTGDLIFGQEIGNWAGENLAWFSKEYRSASLAAQALQSWLDSPGHRENIMRSQFTLTGAGVVRSRTGWMIAQVFAGP
ncbi:MAG: LysM peptidoglycan-binding domain-containing protein [Chloroflexi bacterium]|nr:LysM peptidoglycan-binding domain-containing protein [Chloroflexota bacterium]